MKFVSNAGVDNVLAIAQPALQTGGQLDVVSPTFSFFAFAQLRGALAKLASARCLLPSTPESLQLQGGAGERSARNRLLTPWLALELSKWLSEKAEVRTTNGAIPQGALVIRNAQKVPIQSTVGSFDLSLAGLGITPGNPLSLIQTSQTPDEALMLSHWFDQQWQLLEQQQPRSGPPTEANGKQASAQLLQLLQLLQVLQNFTQPHAPRTIYGRILQTMLASNGDGLDEDKIVKAATGIRDTVVWQKLYKFQRDGAVGAIDKLNRFGGCIIADSVGLGKTFEALAIIKYFELRNDRVLVLAPKRLRDNWTLYKSNDKRNSLAPDRLNYDVLNHTDLSRDNGQSGDIDLSHVNWGNYDLVVIDESHNFRNKAANKGKESRYDRLLRKIIQEGVKTRVLMLSATPVNNRLNDLKNQIAFITEGNDDALAAHGITSIEGTTRRAQKAFNQWLEQPEAEKTSGGLIDKLGFDYFSLLDHLTIARSRKHIERYYGTSETGRFPTRLAPINIKADVDRLGEFRSIREINQEIRRLNLAVYAPLRYVLPHKKAAYDARYNTQIRGGESAFKQSDREESLIHLLRINVLKRMESSVSSFALTVQRQLKDVESILAHIQANAEMIEELDIADVDIEDPQFESLLVGRKVKVLLADVDLIRWKQDLSEDRNRLATLYAAAHVISAERDDKLLKLKALIRQKIEQPINTDERHRGNRKIIVFTAFADTAKYLYGELSVWAKTELPLTLHLETALVTGSSGVQTTLPGLKRDLSSILSAFAPRAKERPADMAGEGELDLLIATDCISEGQNLQDCDWLVNYDIHWNPVRIIQRFGRIDRIGSVNQSIQLVNFWPNMALDEYINLEQRVSGRMVLLDVSATGEENIIEQQSGNPMNDLAYRRNQLLKLQTTVIDLEDLSSGVAITDLTLTDFRIDLAQYQKDAQKASQKDTQTTTQQDGLPLDELPLGAFAVVQTSEAERASGDLTPGIIFCLQAATEAAQKTIDPSYPLAPHYLVHVGKEGTVLLPYTQAKRILDRLKRASLGRDLPDAEAVSRWARQTKQGEDMQQATSFLAEAVGAIVGKSQERAAASLFSTGGTHGAAGEFLGQDDFEVIAYMVIL
jgi:ribosomal protein L22